MRAARRGQRPGPEGPGRQVAAATGPPSLITGTKLADVAVRKKLADGGQKAIDASNDPMIELARLVDAPARAVRKTYEEKVDEPQRQAYGQIAKARFAVHGNEHLSRRHLHAAARLRPGEGLRASTARRFRSGTTLGGTYKHAEAHGNKAPFELPARWLEPQGSS